MINVKGLFPIFLFLILLGCSSSNTSEPKAPIPTSRPRPDFIIDTAPSESQVLPISSFESDGGIQFRSFPDDWENIKDYRSEVCLRVRASLLAQAGDDFLEESKFQERVKLLVDEIEPEFVWTVSEPFELINIVDESGNTLMRSIQPRAVCGYVKLDPGIHGVLFQFRQTSGDILEYKWYFELTRN